MNKWIPITTFLFCALHLHGMISMRPTKKSYSPEKQLKRTIEHYESIAQQAENLKIINPVRKAKLDDLIAAIKKGELVEEGKNNLKQVIVDLQKRIEIAEKEIKKTLVEEPAQVPKPKIDVDIYTIPLTAG